MEKEEIFSSIPATTLRDGKPQKRVTFSEEGASTIEVANEENDPEDPEQHKGVRFCVHIIYSVCYLFSLFYWHVWYDICVCTLFFSLSLIHFDYRVQRKMIRDAMS